MAFCVGNMSDCHINCLNCVYFDIWMLKLVNMSLHSRRSYKGVSGPAGGAEDPAGLQGRRDAAATSGPAVGTWVPWKEVWSRPFQRGPCRVGHGVQSATGTGCCKRKHHPSAEQNNTEIHTHQNQCRVTIAGDMPAAVIYGCQALGMKGKRQLGHHCKQSKSCVAMMSAV